MLTIYWKQTYADIDISDYIIHVLVIWQSMFLTLEVQDNIYRETLVQYIIMASMYLFSYNLEVKI